MLQKGSKNKEVLQLQESLKKLGYKLDVTGVFDIQTEAIIKNYQEKKFVTGIVDELLFSNICSTASKLSDKEYKTGVIKWEPTLNFSSRNGIQVDTLVFHFTTSTTYQGTVNWFKNTNSSSSSHFIIDRDGSITKMVNLEYSAWHAGHCTHKDGTGNMNSRSIGIEIENWGKLRKIGSKYYHPYAEVLYDEKIYGKPFIDKYNQAWMPYTQKQIDSSIALGKSLHKDFNFKYIVGHEDIAIDKKTGLKFKLDPGPAFNLANIRAHIIK